MLKRKRLVCVRVLDGGSRAEQLVQLHELVDFEDIFELKDPRLVIVREDYLDSIRLTRLHYCSVADLEHSRVPLDAHLGHQTGIVLQYVDRADLEWSTSLIRAPLAHLEFETGEPLLRLCMLHS